MIGKFFFLFPLWVATAELRYSNTIGDNAVVEPGSWLWGLGDVGDIISSTVGDVKLSDAVVGSDNVWRQQLPMIEPSLDPKTIVSSSSSSTSTISLNNILFGKVILCSGQSNIDTIVVDSVYNNTAELATADQFPNIRIFIVMNSQDDGHPSSPSLDLESSPLQPWAEPTSENLKFYSALCWYTAKDLFLSLDSKVPVGAIQSAQGGTAIRNWCPNESLAECPQPSNNAGPGDHAAYNMAGLFNGMIAPFTTGPTKLSFVVWDQAESDSSPQTPFGYYGCQSVSQINSWRRWFVQPTLPWIFVHLQPYTDTVSGQAPNNLEIGSALPEHRAAQLQALQLPNVYYASAIDLGDPLSPAMNVHFRNKKVLAERVIGAVLKKHEQPPKFLSQQVYTEAKVLRAVITFSSGGDGELFFGNTTDPIGQSSKDCPSIATDAGIVCRAFEIQTNDGSFHEAKAYLTDDGKGIVLEAELNDGDITNGAYAVGSRYAWSSWPLAILFGGEDGLPVLPFQQSVNRPSPEMAVIE